LFIHFSCGSQTTVLVVHLIDITDPGHSQKGFKVCQHVGSTFEMAGQNSSIYIHGKERVLLTGLIQRVKNKTFCGINL